MRLIRSLQVTDFRHIPGKTELGDDWPSQNEALIKMQIKQSKLRLIIKKLVLCCCNVATYRQPLILALIFGCFFILQHNPSMQRFEIISVGSFKFFFCSRSVPVSFYINFALVNDNTKTNVVYNFN
jgi:hypothetical protein